MQIDYSSLLVAIVLSSAAILLAATTAWMNTHKERYLVPVTIGLGLLTLAITLMSLRNGRYDVLTLIPPFSLLLAGLSFIYAGSRLLVRPTSLAPPIVTAVVGILAMAIPFLAGYMGVGYVMLNLAGGLILILGGIEYIKARKELPAAMLGSAVLFMLTGLSFFACIIPVAQSGDWITYPNIDNWADTLNAAMSLFGISGIGALTLTVHFARSARQHRTEANTDQLTGLLSRRALFDRFGGAELTPGLPVMLFDLDFFKQINDRFGHAHGDAALQAFADVLRSHLDRTAAIARIGGEEFCAVLPGRDRRRAGETAERIRVGFSDLALESGREDSVATVSVGLATAGRGESFDSVLSRADAALYKAKNAGRNVVKQAEKRVAA